jgi:hypothetical protein
VLTFAQVATAAVWNSGWDDQRTEGKALVSTSRTHSIAAATMIDSASKLISFYLFLEESRMLSASPPRPTTSR